MQSGNAVDLFFKKCPKLTGRNTMCKYIFFVLMLYMMLVIQYLEVVSVLTNNPIYVNFEQVYNMCFNNVIGIILCPDKTEL